MRGRERFTANIPDTTPYDDGFKTVIRDLLLTHMLSLRLTVGRTNAPVVSHTDKTGLRNGG